MIEILVLVAPLVLVGILLAKRNAASALAAATVVLEVDEFGVRRTLADEREERIDWVDVSSVAVVRAKSGPHGRYGGVVVLIGDQENGCLIPLNRIHEDGVTAGLGRLPGFNFLSFTTALDEEPPTYVVVWNRVS